MPDDDPALARLAQLELENRLLGDRAAELEHRVFHLARMLAASRRLHHARDRPGLYAAILEVIVNVLGSEDAGIYEPDADGRLHLVAGIGEEAARHDPESSQCGAPLAETLRTGIVLIADGDPSAKPPALWASVPLRGKDRPIGVLAVFRLLRQKASLDDRDRELLELLADQGGQLLQMAPPGGPLP